MSWSRAKFAQALATTLEAAADTLELVPTVFAAPPLTLNPPALVVSRPQEVLYGTGGLGVDVATIPVVCVGSQEGEDMVDELIAFVRSVVAANVNVAGTVQVCFAPTERNWRAANIAGVPVLAADVVLTVQM